MVWLTNLSSSSCRSLEISLRLRRRGEKSSGITASGGDRLAAGAIPFSLCGFKVDPIEEPGKVLSRNLCSLIKNSYGSAATDTCPFFRVSDPLSFKSDRDNGESLPANSRFPEPSFS